jgi:hypothetical protein
MAVIEKVLITELNPITAIQIVDGPPLGKVQVSDPNPIRTVEVTDLSGLSTLVEPNPIIAIEITDVVGVAEVTIAYNNPVELVTLFEGSPLSATGVTPGTYTSVTVQSDGRVTNGTNPGASGSAYVHTQSSPASTWNIAHNLGRFPSVTVVDSAKSVITSDPQYLDNNNIRIVFSAPFSGYAYLN